MRRVICVLLLCLLLLGCAPQEPEQMTVFAMDTVMDFQVWGKDAGVGITRALSIVQSLERLWSATDDASVLSGLNRGEDIQLDPAHVSMLYQVAELSKRTDGAFEPRVYALMDLWGFYDDAHRVPSQAEIDAALSDDRLDLGGVMKGYAGQQIVSTLQALDIDRAILNLGGNVQTYGQKPDGSPWQVGIQNPDGGNYAAVVSVTGTMAVVTSGDYQRYFEENGVKYHHIMDPVTGCPVDNGLRSVTVISPDGMAADALSTALFVMGMETAVDFWRDSDDFEAVFILADGSIYATEGVALSGCTYEVIGREE